LLLASCDKYYVAVRQIPVNTSSLASAHVGTPDPRLAHPPLGQKLVVDWVVPGELLIKQPRVVLFLLYKDHTEKKLSYPIEYKSGYAVYALLGEEFEKTKGLLTYRAEIVTAEGEIYRDWKHQLWVNLITLEQESTSSSVDAQSMQGSVSESVDLSSAGFSEKN